MHLWLDEKYSYAPWQIKNIIGKYSNIVINLVNCVVQQLRTARFIRTIKLPPRWSAWRPQPCPKQAISDPIRLFSWLNSLNWWREGQWSLLGEPLEAESKHHRGLNAWLVQKPSQVSWLWQDFSYLWPLYELESAHSRSKNDRKGILLGPFRCAVEVH